MYKEIGRKITSLTLLSILLASGITFAIPGAMPVAEAAHNANLFVSSENSQFSNYFAGPQVIEVVINDNDIKTLDDAHGEPDVTVNGKKLRMAQATDGSWYGYFADRTQAQLADDIANQGPAGEGTDFGAFCDATSAATAGGPSFTETVGVAFAKAPASSTQGQTTPLGTCTSGPTGGLLNHVVRENKTLNSNVATTVSGQIGLNEAGWPVIQLYDFSVGGNVEIKYNRGGGTQTTTLTFDTIPSNLITHTFDRTTYPRDAEVHVTMSDPQLNIDPTDEDSWTWNSLGTNNTLFYQLFDENGAADADGNATAGNNLIGNLTNLMFEKNGRLTLNQAAQGSTVTELSDNNDQVFPSLTIGGSPSQPITFLELERRSGIFGNYDEADNANLDILVNAQRGKSATIRYNDVSKSIIVGFGFGTVDITAPDGAWGSGEEIPVTLVDSDANKNSRADEDLDLNANSTSLIPALKIGNPFTLKSGDRAILTTGTETTGVGSVPV
ncbi:MAG: hypothetical protein ACRD32_06085, partial [Nitrososphaerales archaeon]